MEKRLLLKVAGAEGEPHEIIIRPGVTASDILESAGLDKNLFLTVNPKSEPLGPNEVVWDKVEDGSKIFAVPQMQVGL